MVRCNICNGLTTVLEVKEQMLGLNEKFLYYQCVDCGHTHLNEVPKNFAKYYSQENYYSFKTSPFSKTSISGSIKSFYKKIFFFTGLKKNGFSAPLKALLLIKGIKKTSFILDYGCGSGSFVKELDELGFENVKGYDPFLTSDVAYKGKLYLTNNMGLLKDVKWDVITLNHVLEHLADPIGILKSLKELLSPKGKLLLRFPVIDSYAFEKYKENWVQFDAPRHINLFTRKSIELAVEKAEGFKIISEYDDSFHFQFTGSELYLKKLSLQPKDNNFLKRLFSLKTYYYHFLAKKLNKQKRGDQIVVVLERV